MHSYASHLTLDSPQTLADWLAREENASWLALDTEFISERRYLPELCLIQIATPKTLAIIDPLVCGDLSGFWRWVCDARREAFVHAARSEMEFCIRAIGAMPAQLYDVQLAAAFLDSDYPSSFGTLVQRFLGVALSKNETRTNWAHRPFTSQQIRYALDDVRYLPPLMQRLRQQLTKCKRLTWFKEESRALREKLWQTFTGETWRDVAKSGALPPRELAIVRALWQMRDEWGRQTNHPAQQILRDDVIVELAKRGDAAKISSLRGIPQNARLLSEIEKSIHQAINLSENKLPQPNLRMTYPHYSAVVSFLQTIVGMICQREQITPMVAATSLDLREWVAYENGTLPQEHSPPKLTYGWRRELFLPDLTRALRGEVAIRLNPKKKEQNAVELVPCENQKNQFELD